MLVQHPRMRPDVLAICGLLSSPAHYHSIITAVVAIKTSAASREPRLTVCCVRRRSRLEHTASERSNLASRHARCCRYSDLTFACFVQDFSTVSQHWCQSTNMTHRSALALLLFAVVKTQQLHRAVSDDSHVVRCCPGRARAWRGRVMAEAVPSMASLGGSCLAECGSQQRPRKASRQLAGPATRPALLLASVCCSPCHDTDEGSHLPACSCSRLCQRCRFCCVPRRCIGELL